MKIISLNTKQIYEIDLLKAGENAMPCPECSKDRKKQRAKSFNFNAEKKTGYCQHCLTSFVEYNTSFNKKEYMRPEWKNNTNLTDGAIKWFEGRGISQDVIRKMKIHSTNEWMPQIEKETGVICFPYFLDETLINIKYRDKYKNFKLCKDAELIFYNINCLNSNKEVIICEGEIDCLSYIQAGFENCISVPNGASGKNMEYLDNYIDIFDKLDCIYLSVDNDIKGYELRNELLRRLGQEKCKIIELDDCKDANEFIIKYGTPELRIKISKAKYLPFEGIIDVNDNYDNCKNLFLNGMEKGKEISLPCIDNLITWETGRVCVVTGIPGHGKSEFVDYCALILCLLHKWKIGYFSPENFPFKYHFSKLSSKLIGKSFDAKYMSNAEFNCSHEYISENIHFVYPEDDMSFEKIIKSATYLVKRHGIRQFVIDPYNKIEHLRNSGESETDYISRFLDKITTFAKKYNVLVWIVAHPTKIKKEGNKFEVPNLYSISGSANWYNKTDYGITVYRDFEQQLTEIHIQKVKFKHLGTGGMSRLKYNFISGRYEHELELECNCDNKPYIRIDGSVIERGIYKQENIELR